jgi:hypothetical protein
MSRQNRSQTLAAGRQQWPMVRPLALSLSCWVTSVAGNDNYIYAKFKNRIFIFLVLYVNNVLLVQGVIKNLPLETKRFMSSHFDIKDLREVSYVFEI